MLCLPKYPRVIAFGKHSQGYRQIARRGGTDRLMGVVMMAWSSQRHQLGAGVCKACMNFHTLHSCPAAAKNILQQI